MSEQYKRLVQTIAESNAKLVVVSKYQSLEKIKGIYTAGQRAFAENRAQDLLEKKEVLPKDIEWHFIGHLQTNKVKYIIDFVHMIHSIDRLKILKEVDKQAGAAGRQIPVLLQFKIATEESKYGLQLTDLEGFTPNEYPNIQFAGVMGMASFTENDQQVHGEFRKLKKIFDQLKQTYFNEQPAFKELSMGMSGDYLIAIEEGSTLLRIGSLAFK